MSVPKQCEEKQIGRVLVVEKNRETLRRLVDRLAAEGIEAVGVSSPAKAMAVMEQGEVGIVVVEVRRSDDDILQFIRQVQAHSHEKHVIAWGECVEGETVKRATPLNGVVSIERCNGSKDVDEELIRHIHHARERVLARYAHGLEAVVAQRTAQLRGQLERLMRLHEVVVRLHAYTERTVVFDATMDAVVKIAGVDRCAILLFDADGVMRFQAWRGLSASYRQGVEGHGPWTSQAICPAPILISDAQAEPTLFAYRALFQQEGIGALAFVPLTRPGGEGILGKLMLYAPTPHHWSEGDIQLVQVLADHVVAALLRIEAEELLRRSYRQREQICLDLHDGILQSLYAVGLLLQVTKRDAETVAPSLSPSLERAVDQLNDIIKDVRSFIEQVAKGAEPLKVARDLRQALDQLIGTLDPVGIHGIERRFAHAASMVLAPERMTQVLSIVKEAISNSLRHSRAARRWVALRCREASVRLEVGDNGIGFDQRLKKRRGMGLSSMASRAKEIGGRLTVRTRPGWGTRVILELPCASGAEPPLFLEQPVMSVTESCAWEGGVVENTPRCPSRTSFSRLAHSGR